MPPYEWLHFKSFTLMIGIGLVLTIAIILARGSRYLSFTFKRRSDKELEESIHEFGGGVQETNRPMPLLIWLVSIGWFIWAISYVVFTGARGI